MSDMQKDTNGNFVIRTEVNEDGETKSMAYEVALGLRDMEHTFGNSFRTYDKDGEALLITYRTTYVIQELNNLEQGDGNV